VPHDGGSLCDAECGREWQAESGKAFFFEKKNQKTFNSWPSLASRRLGQRTPAEHVKVFWFFFSKKNAFLLPAGPASVPPVIIRVETGPHAGG
jgi:hypothetical protein